MPNWIDYPKVCARCRVERSSEAFGTNPSRPDGLDHYCRPCRRPYQAALMRQRRHRNAPQQTPCLGHLLPQGR